MPNKYYSLKNLSKEDCINLLEDAFERSEHVQIDYLGNGSPIRKTCDFITFDEFIQLCVIHNTLFTFVQDQEKNIIVGARVMSNKDYFIWITCGEKHFSFFIHKYYIDLGN